MKIYVLSIVIFLLLTFFPHGVFAESNYVLPYPSVMPGNIFYKARIVIDEVKKLWYFGNFGKFSYNLKQSDKYLVEAKTLFEYKQYLLGFNALQKSNKYFEKVPLYLRYAHEEKKNVLEKQLLLKEAALKHIEVLQFIKTITPSIIIWKPEKSASTNLKLHEIVNKSVQIRKKAL